MPDAQTVISLEDRLNKDLADALANGYLLFDTCVIGELARAKSDSPTKELFDFLNRVHCIPGISDFIYVECLRGHQDVEKLNEVKKWLTKFPKNNVNANKVSNFNELLIRIDRINQKYGLAGVKASYVDLTNAAFLQTWPEKLFLATFNIGDFCHKIFDIVTVLPVIIKTAKGKDSRSLLGVIKANKDNFKEELNKLK